MSVPTKAERLKTAIAEREAEIARLRKTLQKQERLHGEWIGEYTSFLRLVERIWDDPAYSQLNQKMTREAFESSQAFTAMLFDHKFTRAEEFKAYPKKWKTRVEARRALGSKEAEP